jgi:hypothetical protein
MQVLQKLSQRCAIRKVARKVCPANFPGLTEQTPAATRQSVDHGIKAFGSLQAAAWHKECALFKSEEAPGAILGPSCSTRSAITEMWTITHFDAGTQPQGKSSVLVNVEIGRLSTHRDVLTSSCPKESEHTA